jgi:ribose transport system permease protein
MSKAFLTQQNLVNILRQFAMLGISAVGMTLVILAGGIDLSVGSNLGLTGIIAAICMVNFEMIPALAILLGLISATIVGIINGVSITRFRIPPLIATLATYTAVRGVAYVLTGGLPIFGFPKSFNVVGRGMIWFLPVPVLIMLVVFVLGWMVLHKTRYGRYLYAIGGNPEAARLSGIPVKRNLVLTYVYSGIFSGIAGIIMLSRLNSGHPTTGTGFELDVITAVVLGGISIAGGEGLFLGVISGVLIIGVLTNGMILMNVYEYYQQVIKGLVLLIAVGVDQYYKQTGKSRKGQSSGH